MTFAALAGRLALDASAAPERDVPEFTAALRARRFGDGLPLADGLVDPGA